MKLERLYDLSKEERIEIAGRASQLPVAQSAKGASQPLVYRGGKPPVPDGTKIAVWRKGSESWNAEVAKPKTWFHTPRIYRLRDNNLLLQLEAEPIVDVKALAAKELTNRIWSRLNAVDTAPGHGDFIATYADLLEAVTSAIAE
jgi:hypothetical protein